jgi:hypothetical protein
MHNWRKALSWNVQSPDQMHDEEMKQLKRGDKVLLDSGSIARVTRRPYINRGFLTIPIKTILPAEEGDEYLVEVGSGAVKKKLVR